MLHVLLAQTQPPEYTFFGSSAVILVILAMLLILAVLAGFLWFGWWVTNRHGNPCPYSGLPMRRGVDLVFSAVEKFQGFMNDLNDPYNPPYDLASSAISPQSGRIFPNCITIFGVIKLNWNFLNKRYPGDWVSWGSLTEEQQKQITLYHSSLEGFQIKRSSPRSQPQHIDSFYATLKPGPLYVDVATKHVMGWKCVPETNLEVLILQIPGADPHTVYDDVVRAKRPGKKILPPLT